MLFTGSTPSSPEIRAPPDPGKGPVPHEPDRRKERILMLYDSTKSASLCCTTARRAYCRLFYGHLKPATTPGGTTKPNPGIHVFTKCTRCRGRCISRINPTG